jgi:NADH-quinone oxidoreductase subunit C
MTIEAICDSIRTKFNDDIIRPETSYGDLTLVVNGDRLVEIVRYLRDESSLKFDLLLDIAAVDNLKRQPLGLDEDEYDEDERFEVVYIFNSTTHNHRVRIKVILPEDAPTVPTLTDVYGSANWGEREAYDLMGIQFTGHPNLKRILTHFKFKGHALRKDYEVDKEQWLDETEPLVDEVLLRLKERNIDVRLEGP